MRAVLDPSRFKDRDHTTVLPHGREVVSEENNVKDLGEKGYRSMEKMLQGPVQYNVRARSLADFQTLMTS
jgi:hypothetical protein